MANPNEQVAEQAFKVIIAVNMPYGAGYFVDSEGRFLFKKQFEEVSQFTEGLARVKQGDKYGYINTKGEMVVSCTYDDARQFFNGFARVKQNDRWGVLTIRERW